MKYLLLLLSFSAWAEPMLTPAKSKDELTLTPPPVFSGDRKSEMQKAIDEAVRDAVHKGIALGWAQCVVCVKKPEAKHCKGDVDAAIKAMEKILE